MSVARNYIFSLIWRCYGPKQDILDYGEQSYIVYYPVIFYQKVKVYRVETMNMGGSQYNNGVIGAFLISISTTYLLYKIRYFGRIPTMIYIRMWNNTLNNVRFPSKRCV